MNGTWPWKHYLPRYVVGKISHVPHIVSDDVIRNTRKRAKFRHKFACSYILSMNDFWSNFVVTGSIWIQPVHPHSRPQSMWDSTRCVLFDLPVVAVKLYVRLSCVKHKYKSQVARDTTNRVYSSEHEQLCVVRNFNKNVLNYNSMLHKYRYIIVDWSYYNRWFLKEVYGTWQFKGPFTREFRQRYDS